MKRAVNKSYKALKMKQFGYSIVMKLSGKEYFKSSSKLFMKLKGVSKKSTDGISFRLAVEINN